MIGQDFSHYSILERLGEGGMGVVYRARDLTLHRDVALKFLNIDILDDRLAREKILQEARAISALNHPNICTVYEVGEADNRPYLAMEYLEGHPLNQEITSAGLPPGILARYGIQLADALGHAHERGIVHRDFKPGNVIVTSSGRLKVLDFGLSLRIETKVSEDTTQYEEARGSQRPVTGTLPYTAPELLRGQDADARSDIWALGVVLYELAAGRRPFRGGTLYELSWAILREAQPPISPPLPPLLQSVIDKCLDKDPSQRFRSGGEVRAALETASTARDSERIALSASSGHEVAPQVLQTRRRILYGAAAIAALVVLMIGLRWSGRKPRASAMGVPGSIQSLAVLPLENLSGDPAQDYFADGMTDALITQLSQIRKLRVISRTSVMQYKRTQKTIGEISRDLNVDAVVEGSVVRDKDRVKISSKLIQTTVERTLWADSYERDFTDVLALQSDVATAIARGIQVELSGPEASRLASSRVVVPEAYEAYLKGRFEAEKRTPDGLTTSIQYFRNAIAKDPAFAAAYAGLADSLRDLSNYEVRPPAEMIPQAKAAAQKALELDDRLAEAHASLATTRFYNLEWDGVESEFQRAIALNPGYAPALHWYALSLAALGRKDESITEIKLAREIDPRSLIINANVGWCYYLAGDADRAIEEEKTTLRLDPSFGVAHGYLGQAYLERKQFAEAIAELRTFVSLAPGNVSRQAELANAYAVAGKKAEADEIRLGFERLPSQKYISAYDWAMLYAGFYDKPKTLGWLERAFKERNGRMANIAVHPRFAFLRQETDFRDLLRRMGLNASAQSAPAP